MSDSASPPPRILVVEDNETFRDTVRELLRDLGYKVRGARSYNKAVKRLSRHKFDLILTDIDIGEASGFDVLQLARQTRPQAQIILMSASADPEVIQMARESGAARFLPKPFALKDLMQVVDETLAITSTEQEEA